MAKSDKPYASNTSYKPYSLKFDSFTGKFNLSTPDYRAFNAYQNNYMGPTSQPGIGMSSYNTGPILGVKATHDKEINDSVGGPTTEEIQKGIREAGTEQMESGSIDTGNQNGSADGKKEENPYGPPGSSIGPAKLLKGIGAGTDLASQFIDIDEDSSFKGQQAVGDALLQSGNAYAMAAGAAVKATSAIDQALGINVNTLNKDQAKSAGISGFERIANNVLGFLPGTGFGAIAGDTVDAYRSQELDNVRGAYADTANDIDTAGTMGGKTYLFGKKKANAFIEEQNRRMNIINDISRANTLRKQSSYGLDLTQQNQNTYSGNTFQNTAIGKQGMKLEDPHSIRRIMAKYKKGGSNKFDQSNLYALLAQFDYILTGNPANQIIHDVQRIKADVERDGSTQDDYQRAALNIAFNQDYPGAVQELQNETALQYKKLVKEFEKDPNALQAFELLSDDALSTRDPQIVQQMILPAREVLAKKLGQPSLIGKFQNGGSILIPEGALHKNKHHMEDVNPELADELTGKGIPVVTTDEEGNVTQVAEIEQSEIVMEKSLTDKVEKLWKDGSDEAAIECGKLVVDTLFNNCDDNTGLIENTI